LKRNVAEDLKVSGTGDHSFGPTNAQDDE